MPRQVVLKVGRDGGVETEFSGFPGQDCISEAEKLQQVLAGLGLRLNIDDMAMKSPEAIAAETGADVQRKAGRRQK